MERPSKRESGIYGPIKSFSYLSGSSPADPAANRSSQYATTASVQEASIGLGAEDDPRPQSNTSLGALNRRPSYYPPEKKTSSAQPQAPSSRYDHYMTQTRTHGNPEEDRYRSHIETDNLRNKGYNTYGSDLGGHLNPRSKPSHERFPDSPEDYPNLFGNFILRDPDSDKVPRNERYPERGTNYPPGGGSSTAALNHPHEGNSRGYTSRRDPSPRDPSYHSHHYPYDTYSDPGVDVESVPGYSPYRRDRDDPIPPTQDDPYKYNRQLPRTHLPSEPGPKKDTMNGRPLPERPKQQKGKTKNTKSKDSYQNEPNVRPVTPNGDMSTMYRQSDRKDKHYGKDGVSCAKKCKWAAIILAVVVASLGIGFVAAWFMRPLYDGLSAAESTVTLSTTSPYLSSADITTTTKETSTIAVADMATSTAIVPSSSSPDTNTVNGTS